MREKFINKSGFWILFKAVVFSLHWLKEQGVIIAHLVHT